MYKDYEEFDDSYDTVSSAEVFEKRSRDPHTNKYLNNCFCKTYLTARNSRDHGRLRKKCRCYK